VIKIKLKAPTQTSTIEIDNFLKGMEAALEAMGLYVMNYYYVYETDSHTVMTREEKLANAVKERFFNYIVE
jgi:hypothetical protein